MKVNKVLVQQYKVKYVRNNGVSVCVCVCVCVCEDEDDDE